MAEPFDADAKAREILGAIVSEIAYPDLYFNVAEALRSAYAEGERAGQWQPMATAPQDRQIVVWAPDREGLHSMASLCEWHPDAGFCIDELRAPTHWLLPPEALDK